MRSSPSAKAQRGATLIVALVMVVALATLGVFAFNTGSTSLRVVGNSQARHEVVAAAQAAVEATISTPLFTQEPAAVAAAAIPVDIDGDGRSDYEAQPAPAPTCYRFRAIKVNELDPESSADRVCLGSSAAPNPGIEVAGAAPTIGDSLCADSEWNVRATVNDPRTQAIGTVNQGIGVRSLVTDAATGCP